MIYLKLTKKYSLRVKLFIFDIVSSDLCLILSKLRAVQSASQSIEKNLPNVQKEGEGGGGVGLLW